MQIDPISFLGEADRGGIYLLRVHVDAPIRVTFGRFQGGRPISVLPGNYLYIGSALGQRGATSLAGRLLRHATRSGSLSPHAIRPCLGDQLQEVGLLAHHGAGLPRTKRCFWHIDYLLDQLEAEITQIIALRTPHRLEARLARKIAADPVLAVVAPGLGASDDPNANHLFRVDAAATWWRSLPMLMIDLTNEEQK